MKITEKDFNVITNEETITERDETAQEIEARKKLEAEAAERAQARAEAEAKRSVVVTKFEALGLTADEANLLLGGN